MTEQASVADGVEIGEFLSEFSDCYDVVLVIVVYELSVGLGEVGNGCGFVDEVAEEIGVS